MLVPKPVHTITVAVAGPKKKNELHHQYALLKVRARLRALCTLCRSCSRSKTKTTRKQVHTLANHNATDIAVAVRLRNALLHVNKK
jgi:hypothetical protein